MVKPSFPSRTIEVGHVGPITGIVMEGLLVMKKVRNPLFWRSKVRHYKTYLVQSTCYHRTDEGPRGLTVFRLGACDRYNIKRKQTLLWNGLGKIESKVPNLSVILWPILGLKPGEEKFPINANYNVILHYCVAPYGRRFSWPASTPHLRILQFHGWSCDSKQEFYQC